MIFRAFSNTLGDVARRGLEALGYAGALFIESFYWLLLGRRYGQVVSAAPIAAQLMEVGVRTIPIVAVLSFAIGVSLAIQLIFSLSEFGAESKSVFAIAKAVTREFGPLITGILVAGNRIGPGCTDWIHGGFAGSGCIASDRRQPGALPGGTTPACAADHDADFDHPF